MMEFYPAIKHIHMLLALVTLMGFLMRSTWAFMGSSLLEKKLVRIAPHIIDSLFLLSAIILVIMIGQYPFVSGWVTAKLLGLIAYIVFGTMTIKRAPNNMVRGIFFALSVLTFAYIAIVARSKNPLFFL